VTSGTVSIVSGGSRGLGLAIVEQLLARGDCVATFSRFESDPLEHLAATRGDRLFIGRLDAGDSAALRDFVQSVVGCFGRIDHCVANAAIASEGVLATTSDAEIDAMLRVNLAGSIVLVRECVRQMLLQGRRDGDHATRGGSSVVLVSSVVADRGSPGLAVYAATKAGLEGFARSMAQELGPRGIRVNVVAPGFIETDLSASLSRDQRVRVARRASLDRLGAPVDVVGAVQFLTSADASFVSAQVLRVDGGS
jgi:3-oxoacyl-[acyl-carrier protein] reductase